MVRSDAAAGLKLARLAASDLAQVLGIPEERVRVIVFRPVVWPDTSLGCQVSDQSHMAQTPGFAIELSATGKTYIYHSDMATRVVSCLSASER
jgi:hypothetical protein